MKQFLTINRDRENGFLVFSTSDTHCLHHYSWVLPSISKHKSSVSLFHWGISHSFAINCYNCTYPLVGCNDPLDKKSNSIQQVTAEGSWCWVKETWCWQSYFHYLQCFWMFRKPNLKEEASILWREVQVLFHLTLEYSDAGKIRALPIQSVISRLRCVVVIQTYAIVDKRRWLLVPRSSRWCCFIYFIINLDNFIYFLWLIIIFK